MPRKRIGKIIHNNTKSRNKEIINKWREVVNNNVNEESEGVAESKRKQGMERLMRRAQPTEER